MNVDSIYKSNSNFLKAADLQGTKPVLEIESAEVQESTYNGVTKQQIVLTFVGKEKVLGLNVTNARRISQLIGTGEIEEWAGWRIKLYTDQTEFEGKTVDCIRVFPDLPEQNGNKAQQFSGPKDMDDPPF